MSNFPNNRLLRQILSEFWAWLESRGYYIAQETAEGQFTPICRGDMDLIGKYVTGAESRSSGGK